MLQAIGHILPIALAVAISSVPIMATIVILLSPKGAQTALPFLIGWVLGMAVIVTLFTLGAQVIPSPRSDRRPATAIATIEILVGIALVVLGDHRVASRPSASVRRHAQVAGLGRQARARGARSASPSRSTSARRACSWRSRPDSRSAPRTLGRASRRSSS